MSKQKPPSARAITIWYCEYCEQCGAISHDSHISPFEGSQLVHRAHRERNPDCNGRDNMVRILVGAEQDLAAMAEPAAPPAPVCPRCKGSGIQLHPFSMENGMCLKCEGTGQLEDAAAPQEPQASGRCNWCGLRLDPPESFNLPTKKGGETKMDPHGIDPVYESFKADQGSMPTPGDASGQTNTQEPQAPQGERLIHVSGYADYKDTTPRVTVCDKCHQASCWQGIFMCDESKWAGTVDLTIAELRELNTGENECYWTPLPPAPQEIGK